MSEGDVFDPSRGDGAVGGSPDPLPSLPVRLVQVFVSPGRLMERLAETPKWVGALLVTVGLVGLSTALIPVELLLEVQRTAALERGVEMPQGEEVVRATRIFGPLFATLGTAIFQFIFAGIYALVFAFILGDEGRYTQYLAVVVHAGFIAALFGLLLTPLRISTEDPQFTLSLASFFFFLPDGYLYNVLRVLDLTQIWSSLVVAQGAHAIDRRRSFGSAAGVTLGFLLLLALIFGRFM